MTFTPEVYALIREGAQRSAAAIVPWLMEFIPAKNVIDVGCGEGWFAREFAERGCRVAAVDTTAGRSSFTSYPSGGALAFYQGNATDFFIAERSLFDLAICLEVAEHLPESAATPLVDRLCAIAPVVVFSAAVPGQGGHGHLNERWPSYWVPLFERNRFAVTDAARWTFWDQPAVEPWYRQNLLIAAADESWLHEVFGGERPADVVHPVIWEHRRQR